MGKKCNCGVCGEEFNTLSARRRHKKNKHGGYFTKEIKSQEEKKVENKEEIVQEEEKVEEQVEEEPKEALKEIQKITMPKDQAKEAWKKYCEVLKKRKEKFLQIMKDAHYQMKEGRELIDIYKVMKKTGLNENNEPRLAIARADIKEVFFEKLDSGTGVFAMEQGWHRSGWKTDVHLPQNIFKIHWEREEKDKWRIEKKTIKTRVPIVPIELLPDGDLSNYYILWEASEWEELPETKDPILLKRISENLFAILGAWDLTELEQSVIGGLK